MRKRERERKKLIETNPPNKNNNGPKCKKKGEKSNATLNSTKPVFNNPHDRIRNRKPISKNSGTGSKTEET